MVKLARLADPQQVVDLWVLDCWLCTNDRQNEGNTLLVPISLDKVDLCAIDQSDCFGGPQRFSDGSWVEVVRRNRRVEDAGLPLQRAVPIRDHMLALSMYEGIVSFEGNDRLSARMEPSGGNE